MEDTVEILRLAVEFVKIFLVGVDHSDAVGRGATIPITGQR
jgi:hypothetical protein